MKRAISVLMAMALTATMSTAAFAEKEDFPFVSDSDAGDTMNNGDAFEEEYSFQILHEPIGTKPGGNPGSSVGDVIKKGDTFTVVFDSTAFHWSQGGGTYNMDPITIDWVQISASGGVTSPVAAIGISGDSGNGSVTVELRAIERFTAIANLSSGRKYAGTASTKLTSADEQLLDQHPEIDTIYHLKTAGLTGSNCKVTMEIGSGYYVYNKDHDYIGMSGEKLPYSEQYIVAREKIRFDDKKEADNLEKMPGFEDDEPQTPVIETPPTNVHDNPKTGDYRIARPYGKGKQG